MFLFVASCVSIVFGLALIHIGHNLDMGGVLLVLIGGCVIVAGLGGIVMSWLASAYDISSRTNADRETTSVARKRGGKRMRRK